MRCILCTVMVMLLGTAAWAGEVRAASSGGTAAPATTVKNTAVEISINPTANCCYDSNTGYYECSKDSLEDPSQGPDTYEVELIAPTHGGYTSMGIVRVEGEGEERVEFEPEDLCVKERDVDIQWTAVGVDLDDLTAKIVMLQAADIDGRVAGYQTIHIYLNDYEGTFVTQPNDTVAQLNSKICDAILDGGFVLLSEYTMNGDVCTPLDSFFLVVHPTQEMTYVGFRSKDPTVIGSEVALEPNDEDSTTCGDLALSCDHW
jgi:hypothetical protein